MAAPGRCLGGRYSTRASETQNRGVSPCLSEDGKEEGFIGPSSAMGIGAGDFNYISVLEFSAVWGRCMRLQSPENTTSSIPFTDHEGARRAVSSEAAESEG